MSNFRESIKSKNFNHVFRNLKHIITSLLFVVCYVNIIALLSYLFNDFEDFDDFCLVFNIFHIFVYTCAAYLFE